MNDNRPAFQSLNILRSGQGHPGQPTGGQGTAGPASANSQPASQSPASQSPAANGYTSQSPASQAYASQAYASQPYPGYSHTSPFNHTGHGHTSHTSHSHTSHSHTSHGQSGYGAAGHDHMADTISSPSEIWSQGAGHGKRANAPEPRHAEMFDDQIYAEDMAEEMCVEDMQQDDNSAIAGRIGAPRNESDPGELAELLLRVGQRLRGHLDTRFSAFGLSDARFAALSVIREAAPAGCTQAHLAAKLGQCESSISTLVERMRASRLLYRLRAKADRRKRVLMLTDDGRRLFEEGLACRDLEAGHLFAHFPEADRKALADLMGRLFGSLDQSSPATFVPMAERPAA